MINELAEYNYHGREKVAHRLLMPEKIFRVSGQIIEVNTKEKTIEFFLDDIYGIHAAPIVAEMPDWLLHKDTLFLAEVSADALRKKDWANLRWQNFNPSEYQGWTERELLDELAKEFDEIFKEKS